MTNETFSTGPKGFTASILPWILGAVMFVVYCVTLHHHVSPGNLATYVDICGWDKAQHFAGPLTMLINRPFALIPHAWLPVTMNLFSAVCAALSLCLLARSVVLLPHDRTQDERENETSDFSIFSGRLAWLPPIFAVLICGLQRSFWENSIEATGETFDLLIFAYAIRCLLEFRIDQNDIWFTKFAVACGLGMANNWAMVGYFPAFFAAVVWIKGSSAFTPEFVKRMLLFGLAGFSLFLLYPVLNALSHSHHVGFWESVRNAIVMDKRYLTTLSREDMLVVSLTSLLPVFIIGFKWASYFGDNSPLGIFLATAIFRIAYAMFFLACIWVAMDAPISPRARAVGFFAGSFLTFGFLGGLSTGYFCGYFLVVFGPRPPKPQFELSPLKIGLNWIVTGCVLILSVATPAILLARNIPFLHTKKTIYRGYNDYVREVEDALPAKGGVLLSDDTFRLLYLEADLDSRQKAAPYLFVDTGALDHEPAYLNELKKQRPNFDISLAWTNLPARGSSRMQTIRILEHLGSEHQLCYIHCSFGYFFEHYYGEPHGLVYWLKPYPTNVWDTPLPSPDQVAENQSFWKNATESVVSPQLEIIRLPQLDQRKTPWEKFNKSLHLRNEPTILPQLLCSYYARAADDWGIRLQMAGRLQEATATFELATNFFPENLSARINLGINHELLAGKMFRIVPVNFQSWMEKLQRRGGWQELLNNDGPVDDPSLRFNLAELFATGGNQRQAVQNYHRIQAITGGNALVSLELARLMVIIEQYTNDFSMLLPYDHGYAEAITNANAVLSKLPKQPEALALKSVALMQSGEYQEAIDPLGRLLELQTNNFRARLNRAISEFKVGSLDAAKLDYQLALKLEPDNYQSYYGLGEIAFQQKDKYAATKNYQLYLTNAPSNLAEIQFVEGRLQELKNGAP